MADLEIRTPQGAGFRTFDDLGRLAVASSAGRHSGTRT